MIRRFLSWLHAFRGEDVNSGHPDLYPIKVEEISRQLKLRDEGKRLGERNIPAPDADSLSGPEAAVVQRVEKIRLDYVNWAVRRFKLLSGDVARRRSATEAINRAAQAHEEFGREASALLADRDVLLVNLREAAKSMSHEMVAFKEANKLARAPDYPSPTGRFLRIAIVAVLILVEGLLNASFFAQGMSGGLIEGFAMAGALALFNVSVAFGFGLWPVRNLFHHSALWKLVGLTSLVLAVAIMTAFGLAIAHVRDGYAAGIEEPGKYALERLINNPLGLSDIYSWGLFAFSVVFALIALMDGVSFDDRYPGYGPLARRARAAADEYDSELDSLREELEELRERHLGELDRQVVDGRTAVAMFEQLIREKESAGDRLATAMHEADNALRALLELFRTENEVHRNGTRRPAYWKGLPQLRALQLPSFDTSDDIATLAEQRQSVETLLKQVDRIRADIQESFNKQYDRLRPLGNQFDLAEAG